MRTVVVVPPEPIVTVDEAKAYLRVDGGDEDTLIGSLVATATGHFDGPNGWLNRSLGIQTLETEQRARSPRIELPCPPIAQVESVTFIDALRTEQVLDPADYVFTGSVVRPVSECAWRTGSEHLATVRVRYIAGYALTNIDPALPLLPAMVKDAILQVVAGYFSRDPATITASIAVAEQMLASFQVIV